MNSKNQQISDPSKTHLIEDININGYLFGCDDDEVNHDGIWEKPNEDQVTFICDENQINDDNIIEKFFDTPDDAYTFYNQYAFVHRFGIRIHWKYKNKTTNEVYRKLFVCNKQGFKKQKGDNSSEVSKKRRREVRTGCKAELRILKTKGGKWCMDIFNDTHNHDLTTTQTKVKKHRSHNKFHRSMACKSLMVELGKSGLRPCQVRKAVNAMKSPNEPTITSKQCANILAEERKQYKVKHVFPNTRHRYCRWHIKKHVLEHLQPFRVCYSDFQEAFKQWVRSDIVEDFESQWVVLRDKYNLKTSNWMMEMYKQRKFWVSAFFKDIFLAGMTTSGRSESIHSFFDGFMNSKTMLNEFVIQFDKVVDTRRAAEEDEDFKTINSMPVLSSIHPIEAKAGKLLLSIMFQLLFCEQLRYKGGNASIGIDKTNSKNGVTALTLWYVQANLTKAIKQARDAPSEIKRLNIRDPVVLTILKGRPRNATRVKPPIKVKQKKTVTCSYYRKPGHNITGCKEKKAASMQEKK
ncbi:FAR1-related sequence 5-like protein [Tanacetum coccineum]